MNTVKSGGWLSFDWSRNVTLFPLNPLYNELYLQKCSAVGFMLYIPPIEESFFLEGLCCPTQYKYQTFADLIEAADTLIDDSALISLPKYWIKVSISRNINSLAEATKVNSYAYLCFNEIEEAINILYSVGFTNSIVQKTAEQIIFSHTFRVKDNIELDTYKDFSFSSINEFSPAVQSYLSTMSF